MRRHPRGGRDSDGGSDDGGKGGASSARVVKDIPLRTSRVRDDGGGGRETAIVRGHEISSSSRVQNPLPDPASARAVQSSGKFCSRKVSALFWDLSGVSTETVGAGALFLFSADFVRDDYVELGEASNRVKV